MAAVIVLSHSAIAHKEISYIYAALPPTIIVAGLGTAEIIGWFIQRPPIVLVATSAFWAATSLATALNYDFRSRWRANANILYAEKATWNDPELCGLGVRWPAPYYWTGDSYLGRPIPIYAFGTVAGAARVAPAVNFVIGGDDVADGLPGFSVVKCWSGGDRKVCLARAKPGTACVPDASFDVNSVPNLGRIGTELGADPR